MRPSARASLPKQDYPEDRVKFHGAGIVLVVEDELGIRELVCEVLKRHGYEVETAEDGEEAFRIAEDRGKTIGMVLTDLIMPGVSGIELARQLRASFPRIKVLLMSGYSEDTLDEHGPLDPDTALLEKPFTTKTLIRKVDELMRPGT